MGADPRLTRQAPEDMANAALLDSDAPRPRRRVRRALVGALVAVVATVAALAIDLALATPAYGGVDVNELDVRIDAEGDDDAVVRVDTTFTARIDGHLPRKHSYAVRGVGCDILLHKPPWYLPRTLGR